ncbi:uncharacterized protein B0P05DRAFT_543378 [Gilbertella persicaria]|uniref:uncharacterized protein n=1 Tax=Gilbertella persicaria TaxID=101096 RepID=UPI00221E5B9F|nr:uncharacterized protein B0P05DRAFT_543378 [Gilbertella persicaria]KAI8077930.1 hypothetical protein B0P05DRAFT_543378 [Gilbertella persicaria]
MVEIYQKHKDTRSIGYYQYESKGLYLLFYNQYSSMALTNDKHTLFDSQVKRKK